MQPTTLRSAAATMQVLAAIRGETLPPAGLTVDLLLSGRLDSFLDIMNRRAPGTRPTDDATGRMLRYPPPRVVRS